MFGTSCVAWDSCSSILRIWTGLHWMSLKNTFLGCRSLHKTIVRFARELSPTIALRALLSRPSISTIWFLRYLTFLHWHVVRTAFLEMLLLLRCLLLAVFSLNSSTLPGLAMSYPSLWKRANIIPLQKSEAPSSPSEFKPIALLCFLSFNYIITFFRYNLTCIQ